ncbi:hypothetical protein AOT82_2312 [Psychrobacter sp. AntiMn-1]|nr:hypothetical protein AOT82_2312 [Psychrobacter sp. AntiMn-1]
MFKILKKYKWFNILRSYQYVCLCDSNTIFTQNIKALLQRQLLIRIGWRV